MEARDTALTWQVATHRYETEVTRLKRELYFFKQSLSAHACSQMEQRRVELHPDTGVLAAIRLAKSQPWYSLHAWG
jgi:hypothetical protein